MRKATMLNRNSLILLSTVCGLQFGGQILFAQPLEKNPDVLDGPAKAKLESVAEINVPEGYFFLDGKATRQLLKKYG